MLHAPAEAALTGFRILPMSPSTAPRMPNFGEKLPATQTQRAVDLRSERPTPDWHADFPQLGRPCAVYGEHYGLLQEWVLDGLQVCVKRDYVVFAGLIGEINQDMDQLVVVRLRCGQEM
jgi:hypothetical protein